MLSQWNLPRMLRDQISNEFGFVVYFIFVRNEHFVFITNTRKALQNISIKLERIKY